MSVSDKTGIIWHEWNIRGAVFLSLVFQVVLIALASSRRRNGSRFLVAAVWSSYLLADWIAAFAVGLISKEQSNESPGKAAVNKQVASFWAPFLLLHLGGPDAITAFSLEDNELWDRHLLGVIIQLVAVVYVFLQSLPNDYWIPTGLLFLAGSCKYAERTLSLYRACLKNFKKSLSSKPDPGPNYAQLMAEYSAFQASGVPVKIKVEKEPDKDVKKTDEAVKKKNDTRECPPEDQADDHDKDVKKTNETREPEDQADDHDKDVKKTKETQECPTEDQADDHDKDVKETNETREPKDQADDQSTTTNDRPHCWEIQKGYEFFATFKGLIVDHMFSFHERDNSRRFFLCSEPLQAFKVMEVELNFMYDALHTKMTFVHSKTGYFCRLFCCALIAACFQQFASLPHQNMLLVDKIVSYILLGGAVVLEMVALFNLLFSDWVVVTAKEAVSRALTRLPLGRWEKRWSGSMSQFSCIHFCLDNERLGWLKIKARHFGVKDVLNEFLYKKEKGCGDELKEFVFKELKAKAENAESTKDAKEIYSSRGDYVLNDSLSYYFHHSIRDSLSEGTEYDESLLLWHIATELCYFTTSPDDEKNGDRELCKRLSDYMLYLLIMRPALMSTVAGIAEIRFQDTCEEAKKFFKQSQMQSGRVTDDALRKACQKLLDVKTAVKPVEVKGDRSKSLLFDACILANDLRNQREQWKIMSRIWVELLCYGASHCRPSDHARQLAQGGEFITFVWLLMVHFGLGEQFRIHAGHARAKLLVEK